jgi:hypothetical protein
MRGPGRHEDRCDGNSREEEQGGFYTPTQDH